MAPSASDVGRKYDCLIDGQGYIFDDALDSASVYAQHQRAELGLSPTFIERQNVSGDFGDNQQDFFLTFTQRDWSEGEQQRYFRQADDDSRRRYWTGTNIDVREAGKASLRSSVASITASAALYVTGYAHALSPAVLGLGATNLYSYPADGAEGNQGGHGLGTTPRCAATDGKFLYLSSTAAGTVGVRSWNGAAFATFSASGADALAFVNNTLYGYRESNGDLVRYDSAGALTSLFTWKDAAGAAAVTGVTLRDFGGKVLILRNFTTLGGARGATIRGSELWLYDGTAPAMIHQFNSSFNAFSLEVFGGIVVVGGVELQGSTSQSRPTIYYYANGTIGKLWEARTWVATGSINAPTMATLESGLFFTDDVDSKLMFYNPAVGGTQSLGTVPAGATLKRMSAGERHLLIVLGTTTAYRYPGAVSSSATLTTSLADFDSSLDKVFRGIRVEFDSATDGNGGTVDISYRVGDVDGPYTSLQTGATSGTEYTLSGITGRSISVQVTLNKGTSTNGPALKRVSVRGVPVQPQYVQANYCLACYGSPGPPYTDEKRTIKLRDGSDHTKTGLEMVADLKTAAAKSSLSITDLPNGTFTGVLEAGQLRIQQHRPGEYRVFVTARQI